MEHLLRVSALAKSFNGVPALRDGRLDLRRGTVHALCGGNGAGKSTFLNILMGLLAPDSGEIEIEGRVRQIRSANEALSLGIAIITQELSLAEDLTVAENLFLGQEPTVIGKVSFGRMIAEGQALLDVCGFDIRASDRVADLNVARKQLVEIARAIGRKSRILIMDEPTSALGLQETEVLFDAIRRLRHNGTAIIYVSHRLSELFEIADDYTVFRDGRFVQSGPMAELNRDQLVHLIVGKEPHKHQGSSRNLEPTPKLSVSGFSREGEFADINLDVRKSEILGIYGLIGSGRSEFLNCLYGVTQPDRGRLLIDGAPHRFRSPLQAIQRGVGLISEDRKESGLVGCLTIRENITVSSLKHCGTAFWVRKKRERALIRDLFAKLDIRAASPEIPVELLSGGNQQKVVFARCLMHEPEILLCDEPTRGVDEGAKQQIYQIIEDFAAKGGAVIVVSSEIEEILQISDRIAVFKRGAVVETVAREDANQTVLTKAAA